MQKRAGLLTVFLLFLILSFVIFILFRSQVFPVGTTVLDTLTFPAQRSFYNAFGGLLRNAGGHDRLEETNRELAKKIVDQQALIKEAKALRDQYDTTTIPSERLRPARVIGMKSFIPGVSLPEEIVLDQGRRQQVHAGQTVVLTKNVIGKVTAVSDNRSLVSLISNRDQSITAKTAGTGALGVLRGKGSGTLALENVVLSDSLKKDDLVVTKGEQSLDGSGYPPDLVIGKITTIDKKASDLFQSAEVESLVNFATLSTVFIITDD